MICVDTTFLVDLWRAGGQENAPSVKLLRKAKAETFIAPSHAAGEFLEGGAAVSEKRYLESLRFIRLFSIGTVRLETAELYAKTVADLRSRNVLKGMSKPDLWIAAWALEHGCPLATRNIKHFQPIKRLELIFYA